MSITYLDPSNSPADANSKMSDRPEDLDGIKIGLLDNGKTNSKELLNYLSEILQARYERLQFEILDKPSPFKPTPEEQLQDVSVKYGAVITGVGD